MFPQLEFSKLKNSTVSAAFDTPEMTSDSGVLLLREVDQVTGLISLLSKSIADSRHPSYITHSIESLVRQRVFQICQGYEDADDCDNFRSDVAFKTAVGINASSEQDLGSQPTMTRLENSVTISDLFRWFYAQIDLFCSTYAQAPKSIVIDVDPTSSHCFGSQQLSMFNAYEDEYCLMPFHVYDGITGRVITTIIRPGKTPSADEIISLLKRIVRRIRRHFPQTVLIFRADGHHSKPRVHEWCKKENVEFIIGQPGNAGLHKLFASTIITAEKQHKVNWRPIRLHASGWYKAGSWKEYRKIICRVLVDEQGRVDTRYIVTSFKDTKAKYLYEIAYCGRANAELYIKEHKRGLQSDRTSCNKATANQFRLFLHSAAYSLMHSLRENLLKGTSLASATFETIRLRLLKVAARITVKKTRIHFHMPEDYPFQDIFRGALQRISVVKT